MQPAEYTHSRRENCRGRLCTVTAARKSSSGSSQVPQEPPAHGFWRLFDIWANSLPRTPRSSCAKSKIDAPGADAGGGAVGGSICICWSRALHPLQVHHLHPPHTQTFSPSATFLLHTSQVPQLPRLETHAVDMVSTCPHPPQWHFLGGAKRGTGIAGGGAAGLTSWAVQGIDVPLLPGGWNSCGCCGCCGC